MQLQSDLLTSCLPTIHLNHTYNYFINSDMIGDMTTWIGDRLKTGMIGGAAGGIVMKSTGVSDHGVLPIGWTIILVASG
jgi:hypothetical protein